MAREITLEELAQSAKSSPSNSTTPKEEAKPVVKAPVPATETFNAGEVISAQDLSSHLRKVNGVEPTETLNSKNVGPVFENAFSGMAKTLEDRKRKIEEEVMPIVMENAYEMAAEAEANAIAQEEGIVESVEDEVVTGDNIDAEEEELNEEDDLDSLLANLEQEEEKISNSGEDETTEELRERFKESFNDVKIINDPIDLNNFKIRKKPISSSTILADTNKTKPVKHADWVLYHTGRSMTFRECNGPELDALRKTINASNGVNGVAASLRFIYEHTTDGNKLPFEVWCKTIRTEDIESLYFGLYYACYSDSNLVARACVGKNGCNKTSLIETNISDMVKYEDEKVKNRFMNILNRDTTTETDRIESRLYQISDDFVISYSMPTLYSTFIQYASISPKLVEKHTDMLNTMAYIDDFFKIDRETGELIPIQIKEYPNNINKTVIEKLKTYSKILKTLTTDQYNVMTAKLNNVIQESKVKYIYPETTCPECGNTLPEENVDSVLNLLFTRAQLIQVVGL